MGRKKLILLGCLLLLLLCGCVDSASLYALPAAAAEDSALEEALGQFDGYEHHGAVQRGDLTGDGGEEAVLILEDGSRSPKLCIFSRTDGGYDLLGSFDCAGTAVFSLELEDITGDTIPEVLVLSGISGVTTKALQVYGLTEEGISELFSEPCGRVERQDLNGDGTPELYCIADAGDTAEVITYMAPDGVPLRMGVISLHCAYEDIARVQVGTLADGNQALLISGILSAGNLYTEPVVASEWGVGSLTGGMARLTEELCYTPIRGHYAYPQDVDGDGDTDFPVARELPRYDAGSTAQYVIDWYDYGLSGAQGVSTVTYHNFSGGWYLRLPEAWWTDIAIRETDESTTRDTVTIYRLEAGKAKAFFTIYELQGEDRQDIVEGEELTILFSDTGRTLAVGLCSGAEKLDEIISTAQVAERFFLLGNENEISGTAE